ncbi:hypothetical protein DV738_g560, partial [Chaetothyriales sp. CBS 135597]
MSSLHPQPGPASHTAPPLTCTVTIELCSSGTEPFRYPRRTLTLSAPYWKALVGRSTNSTGGQQESALNAFFGSKVVSRDHAQIRAHPDTRLVTIEDLGSLHGTILDDYRVTPGAPETLAFGGSSITLGTEVERVESMTPLPDASSAIYHLTALLDASTITFKPVTALVYYMWSDGEYGRPAPAPVAEPAHSRNSFTADYSDDGATTPYLSEDEPPAYFPPSLQHISRTFTVPSSSDISDDHISILSDEHHHDELDSPSSSPAASTDLPGPSSKEDQQGDAPEAANSCPPRDSAREVIQLDSDFESSSLHEAATSTDSQRPEEDQGPLIAAEQAEQPQSKISEDSGLSPDASLMNDGDNNRPGAPAANQTTTRSPPFLQSILNNANSEPPKIETQRPGSAWAGHNAVLYEPTPVSLYPAVPSATGHAQSDLDLSAPANGQTNRLHKIFDQIIGVDRRPRSNNDAGVQAGEPSSRPAAVTCTLADVGLGPENKPNRKRKLEEESCDDTKGQHKDTPVAKDTAIVAVAEVVEQQPSFVDVVLERPTKQQKTVHVREGRQAQPIGNGSRFATFAAGALAGVVGTFIGLASLPEDYFA